jgi:Family of unknown function (DUF6157)
LHSTNYFNTFIAVSHDCPVTRGEEPGTPGSIAAIQYELLREKPYRFTSDDLLFAVHARRTAIPEHARTLARDTFFAKPLACLRASPLVKQYGWGLHHDEHGRVAAYGVETDRYRLLAASPDLKVVPGMRSRRA